MPHVQAGYEWLWKEPGPKMLLEALALVGTHEVLGEKSNPVIMGWAADTHQPYHDDSVPWCGLGQAISAKRAGWDFDPGGNALWARNWALWGIEREGPALLGDILVFKRGSGGHVAQYVGEDDTHYHILGFNQSDGVNIVRKAKADLIAKRHAPWKTAQPPNVRRIFLSSTGAPTSAKED